MARKKTIRTKEHPYHITNRSNQKTWYRLPMDQVWGMAINSLSIAFKKYPANLHCFVLMNNHYHMVLDTPGENIDKFMYEFSKNFSLQIRKPTNLINKMFGGRYKWSLITTKNHYYQVMKYVYCNPVRANISNSPEKYPYSTLWFKLNGKKLRIPFKPFFEETNSDLLHWFQQGHTEKQKKSIKRGLVKTEFAFSGSREDRLPPRFDNFG